METEMKLTKSANQNGIVALVTVIFASILFSIVVVSMFAVISSEQHQASEADLANRAYFAAESGVEQALYEIKNGTETENTCNTDTTPNPSQATYTCQKLTHVTSDLTHSLVHDQAAYQVNLTSVPNITKIVISWHQPSVDGLNYTLPTAAAILGGTFSEPGAGDTWNYPALLEVQSVVFKANAATFNVNDPSQFKLFETTLVPSSDGSGVMTEDDSAYCGDPTCGVTPSAPQAASCGPAGSNTPTGYACTETINVSNGSTFNRLLRLRARYRNTNFSVQVYSNGALYTNISDSYENIDVTAKSGDTYKRVKAQVQIQQNTVALDYALYSDTDICHDYLVRDSHNGAGGGTGDSFDSIGSCPL
jgi:Tfp pilus assembly protein PilX